jgi:DNA invertase Pin-like site-specific DNA recombinase
MGRQVLGMMAEQFSRDLSQRLTGVVAAHVRMGKHMGKAPLGYCRGDDDHLHINPDTEQAARDVFQWRMDGMGSPAIKTRAAGQIRPRPVRILDSPHPGQSGLHRGRHRTQ